MSFQRIFQAKPDPAKPLQNKPFFASRPAPAQETAAPDHEEAAPLPVGFGRDYSHIPFRPPQPPPPMASVSCPFSPQRCPFGGACHACPPKMQAKLKIGQPGDQYEQEADRVAEQVMRMPEPQAQRKCSAPGCKDEDDEKKLLQTKPASAGEAGAQVDHPLIQSVLSSPGQPLDAGTRSFVEPRFGQDFSGVRVHVGGEAAESARAVNARAYTVGRDVVFGEGQYAPGSDEGKRLVAHELVHVGQQKTSQIVLRRQTDSKQERDVIISAINAQKPDYYTAYNLLNKQWMKIMLDIIDSMSIDSIEGLISNADDAQKNTLIGEGGKNRVLSAVFAVKSTKVDKMKNTDIEMAKRVTMTILIDQRREIISFLSNRRSEAAKKLRKELNKPFIGYLASGYDFSKRFFQHSDKLGFDVESEAKNLPMTSWRANEEPDQQQTTTTTKAEGSFEKSDILFFSGHQYAQYGRPGLFTNDSSDKTFNIGAISKKINKVRLIVSTSCATICRDTAKIFISKFPNALILGYKFSAPLNGGLLSKAFSEELLKKGPVDLSAESGLDVIRSVWRKESIVSGSKEGQPGMLYGNDIEYYKEDNRKGSWKHAAADSDENKCHYHV